MAPWLLGLRPVGRDRQRQRRRKPARCHRSTVAGCTTARAERHAAVTVARFPMSQRWEREKRGRLPRRRAFAAASCNLRISFSGDERGMRAEERSDESQQDGDHAGGYQPWARRRFEGPRMEKVARTARRTEAHRDPAQRRAFQHSRACPSTGKTSGACPGYVVDHVVSLKRGGADHPSNMQWQTVEAAKAKDKTE